MTPMLPPICMYCARLAAPVEGEPPHCTAFPKGVPKDIWQEGADHRKAREGDGGLRFALDEEKRNEFNVYAKAREALA